MNGVEVEEVEIIGALLAPSMDDLDILGDDAELMGWGDGEYESVGGFFDGIAKAVSSAAKAVGKGVSAVVKSPITKIVAGAAAVVFPPIGIPASAALVVADRAVRVAEGARGTPPQQAAMKKAIAHTINIAKAGDDGAKRAVEFMAAARRVRATQAKNTFKKNPVSGTLVRKDGTIQRGQYVKA